MEEITQEHIINNALELYKKPKINGLYFLISSKVIVYIGSGNDVYKRIAAHKQTRVKRFSKYFILETKEKALQLYNMETEYIAKWKPIYNKTSNPDYHNNTKPLWFIYISQDKSIADISKGLEIPFQKLSGIIKGKRMLRDETYYKVEKYMLEIEK
ncbi:hypothetical protein [Flagellimonas sp. CMM7]|uniref:hypothetical protein n=1 Tax=Flagellimonas sp. CMM7 TaxID=2654676 RepID=UPI0013D6D9F6|nr:hypothetical protein [Flagellimonas sp. CMM7]UII80022.1 hypothetical protein LV704_00525 [Flagellimonas sp. CMM7]